MTRMLGALLCLAAVVAVGKSQEAKQPAKKKQLSPTEQKIRKLQSERRDLATKQSAARQEIETGNATKSLRDAVKAAESKYREAVEAHVDDARKKEVAAREKLHGVISDAVAAHKEIPKLQQQTTDAKAKIADLNYGIALKELELNHSQSPINRALNADPELQRLRGENWNKYHQVRRKKFAELPAVKKLQEEIAKARKDVRSLENSILSAGNTIRTIKRKIETSDDLKIKAARDNYNKARSAVYAYHRQKPFQAMSGTINKARQTLRDKINDLIKTDKTLAKLKKEMSNVERQLRILELQRRIQEMQAEIDRLKKTPAN